jgi:hypothetical protein
LERRSTGSLPASSFDGYLEAGGSPALRPIFEGYLEAGGSPALWPIFEGYLEAGGTPALWPIFEDYLEAGGTPVSTAGRPGMSVAIHGLRAERAPAGDL